MIVIIDGYNVLKKLLGSAHASEKQRDQFIKQLCRYAHKKNHTLLLIFDGGLSLWPETFTPSTKMKVIYVGKNKSADDYIQDYIETHKSSEIILVSSDRALNRFAEQRSITSIDAPVFLAVLEEAFEQKNVSQKRGDQPLHKISDTEDETLDELMASLNPLSESKEEGGITKKLHKEKMLSKKERFLLEKLKKL